MIGPSVKEASQHPRSLLKRKQPPPEVAAKRAQPEVVDIVSDVCSYETISDYIQLFGSEEQTGSPASLESGYQTGPQDDEDSNLSWLLNFKVSSLFDPAEDRPTQKREETCLCMGSTTGYHRSQPGKPPFTYTDLIEKALKEQGELTVSGIYNWISSKYPYYSPSDDRWKNSVRHNLSINPHFRKGVKSRHGAGHLWTLSNEGINPPPDSWKRCRIASEVAVRSESPSIMDEAAIAAASIMQLDTDLETEDTLAAKPEPDPVLHRVAEEILSGVKRRVEVQYLVHDQNTNDSEIHRERWLPDHTIVLTVPSDISWSTPYQPTHFNSNPEFLNPVSKEEVVSESGLSSGHCEVIGQCESTSSLLSELNSELNLPDNLFSDELAFTCYSQL